MRLYLYSICILLSISLFPAKGFAQKSSKKHTPLNEWQFGAMIGFGQYYGDVSNKNYFSKLSGETKFSGGIFARRIFNDLTGIGVNIQRSSIYSEKDQLSDGTALNYAYSGNVFEFGVHAYMNFTNLFWGAAERKVNFYGTVGLSYLSWTGTLSDLAAGTTVYTNGATVAGLSYKTNGLVLPATLGLDIRVSPNLSIFGEGSLHTVLSDDLDFYADGFPNDIMLFTHVGLVYHLDLGKGKKKRPSSRINESPLDPMTIDYDNTGPNKGTSVEPDKVPVLDIQMERPAPQQKAFEFRVQVLAKTNRVSDIRSIYPNVKFDYPVVENVFNNLHRYSTGTFYSFSEAEAYAKTMRNRGIYDAFVVAYQNTVRIPITAEMKR